MFLKGLPKGSRNNTTDFHNGVVHDLSLANLVCSDRLCDVQNVPGLSVPSFTHVIFCNRVRNAINRLTRVLLPAKTAFRRGRTDGRASGRTGERKVVRTDVRTNGRTDGRTPERTDERTDGRARWRIEERKNNGGLADDCTGGGTGERAHARTAERAHGRRTNRRANGWMHSRADGRPDVRAASRRTTPTNNATNNTEK